MPDDNTKFRAQILHSIAEIDPDDWDRLAAGQPFQSHRWYRFGERVMADCPATYILLHADGAPVARAALWQVRHEPLPLPPGLPRKVIGAALERWPLLVCRSPLSFLTGLVLPEPPLRDAAVRAICQAAQSELRRQHGSFLVFDFLESDLATQAAWPSGFTSLSVSDPGTVMPNRWESLDAYLASGNKKDRQHYKRSLREVQAAGIEIENLPRVPDVDAALGLIRKVEDRHGAPPNPWARGMLENLSIVGGAYLAAHRDGALVGCGLLFEDNGGHMTATLGLADNAPFVYFQLIYASLQDAFSRKVKVLRWGSGAYQVKERLGFTLETNNHANVLAGAPIMNIILKMLIKVLL